MSAKLIHRVEEYRWRERIESRAAAIRALLEIALKQVEQKPPEAKVRGRAKKPSDD